MNQQQDTHGNTNIKSVEGNANRNKLLARASIYLLFVCAFVLGIKQLREPDFWWMLHTGDWIIENLSIPHQDMFSYTYEGVSWTNVKWGYEVLLSLVSNVGIEATMLIQAFLNVLLIFILYNGIKSIQDTQIYKTVFIGCALLLLLACEFRFNGRPEMVSHVFTALFVFSFIAYYEKSGTQIFWLIPMQVLWANFHEAYGTGMVMAIAFAFGYCIDFFIFRAHHITKGSVWNLIIVTAGIIVAPAIHPYGPRMILHPYEIFTQVGDNKFTTELLDYTTAAYWQKEAWFNIGFLVFSIIAIFSAIKTKKKFIKEIVQEYSVGYLILLVLFFYLSLTAYRNIPFFIIVSFPMLYKAMVRIGDFLNRRLKIFKKIIDTNVHRYVGLVVIVGFYVSIVSGFYYSKFDDGRDRFGLKVNPYFHPIGAASAIPDNLITKHNFSDYLVSNYPMWAAKGKFKTYLDLRDLDVFPSSFFDHFAVLNIDEDSLNAELAKTNSQFVMLTRANFVSLHNKFYNDSNWQILYADPVAVVFEKVKGVKKHGKFEDIKSLEISPLSHAISRIFNPFWHDKNEELNLQTTACSYFLSVGDYERAEAELKKAEKGVDVLKMYGAMYLRKGNEDTTANRNTSLKTAEKYYSDALALNKNDWEIYFGLGRVAEVMGDAQAAATFVTKASKLNTKNADIWFELFKLENMQGGSLKKQETYLENAYVNKKEDVILQYYYGIILCQNHKCDKGRNILEDLLEHPGLDAEQKAVAKDNYSNCK